MGSSGIFYFCLGSTSLSQGSTGYVLTGLFAWAAGGFGIWYYWVNRTSDHPAGEGLIASHTPGVYEPPRMAAGPPAPLVDTEQAFPPIGEGTGNSFPRL